MTDESIPAATRRPRGGLSSLLPPPVTSLRPRSRAGPMREIRFAATVPLAAYVGLWALFESILGRPRRAAVVVVVAATAYFVWLWTFSIGGPFDRFCSWWAQARARRRRDEPWLGDHRWDPRGDAIRMTAPVRARFAAYRIVPVALLAALAGVAAGPAPWLAAVLATPPAAWLWSTWRAWCRGRPHVAFTRFPYFPGEPVELHLGISDGGAHFVRARYFLRRIEEVRGAGPFGAPGCTCTFRTEFVPPRGVHPGPGADVRLVFDVPADAGGTSLAARFPAYWELEVVADTNRGPFAERFLVPVYERPRAKVAA